MAAGNQFEGHPIYSMTDGTVVKKETYSNGVSALVIQPNNQLLPRTFYIRYLHGIYSKNEGDVVQKGEQIGTISNKGTNIYHLHIDFSYVNNDFDPVVGTLTPNFYIVDGINYNISNIVNRNVIKQYCKDNGNQPYSDESTSNIGYCWLIFAQEPAYQNTPSSSIVPDEEGMVEIDRTMFIEGSSDTHPEAADAYFEQSFTENFCGSYPETWEDFKNNPHLRCLVDCCMHEVGGWPIACAIWVKLLRANVLCSSYLNYNTRAGSATDMYHWMLYTTEDREGFIGPWEGYLSGKYIYNNGNGCFTPGSGVYLSGTDEDLKRVRAIYNNFRYPHIYGLKLQDDYLSKTNYLSSLVKAAKIMPVANGGYWDVYDKSTGAVIHMVSAAMEGAIVNYNPATNTDDGKINLNNYYNRWLMYRQNGNIGYYNTNPL